MVTNKQDPIVTSHNPRLTMGCAGGGVPFHARKPSHCAALGRLCMSAAMTGACRPNRRGPHTLAARAAIAAADARSLRPGIGGAPLYSSCHAAVGVLPVTAALPSGVTLQAHTHQGNKSRQRKHVVIQTHLADNADNCCQRIKPHTACGLRNTQPTTASPPVPPRATTLNPPSLT